MPKGFFDSSGKGSRAAEVTDKPDWSIAKGLSTFRRENKLTQGEMAKLMGVSIRAYQGYERGEHTVQANAIETLARNTSADISFLMTGRHPEPEKEQLEAWAKQVIAAYKYIKNKAPNLDEDKHQQIVVAYFKLDASNEKFNPERVDPILEMFN